MKLPETLLAVGAKKQLVTFPWVLGFPPSMLTGWVRCLMAYAAVLSSFHGQAMQGVFGSGRAGTGNTGLAVGNRGRWCAVECVGVHFQLRRFGLPGR